MLTLRGRAASCQQTIATNLRTGRRELGLPVDEFARLAGLDPSTIRRGETGNCDMRLPTAVKLAGALGTTLVALCGGPLEVAS